MTQHVNNELTLEITTTPHLHFSNCVGRDGVLISSRYPIQVVEVVLRDYTADAMRKLLDAGTYGVFAREIKPDAIARLAQFHIPVRAYSIESRGTGRRPNWLELKRDPEIVYRVVSDSLAVS